MSAGSTSPIMASSQSRAMKTTLLVMLVIIVKSWDQVSAGYPPPHQVTRWTNSHATFYGGDDARGTMGGACGYGNLYNTGYGINSAALSTTLFNRGLSCGACFQIKCILSQSRWCYRNGGIITVTATNLCPPNWNRRKDGWCNPPRTHFDLSYPIFSRLARKVGGIIPIQYRRVPCYKRGGIRFAMNGNPWFNLVLVFNVGGAGNVVNLQMRGGRGRFFYMQRNWGANWELKQKLHGQSISFLTTLGNGKYLVSNNVCPKSWGFGRTYECINNFR